MTRDRHERLGRLFELVIGLEPAERERLVEAECAGDDDLRRELEELLAAHGQGEIFEDVGIERSEAGATPAPDSLAGGSVGRYRILDRIGEGGMSVVYRAEDEMLSRPVALKFLSPLLAHSGEARDRFLREARTAAAIDHPNVCHIYEIDTNHERPFIAMAYLEGHTLAGRLACGPLAVDEAVDIAIQTCRGLEAAHAKGVVHRDIKPANLMLVPAQTGAGPAVVKILDFGIASFEREQTITKAGTSLGTFAYMSPEQIASEKADERADLWALGATLYEMLAGRRAFDRASPRELAAAISAAEPAPLAELRSGLPSGLAAVVERLLRKEPGRRYAAAADVAAELERVQLGAQTGIRPPGAWARPPQGWTAWRSAAAAGLLAALAVAAYFSLASFGAGPTRQTEELRPRPLTSYPGKEAYPALSPDGRMLAFSWTGEDGGSFDLYVQPVEGYQPLRLTNYPEAVVSPAWSPDGTRIAFLRRLVGHHELRIVPSSGGPDELVRTIPGDEGGPSLDWSPAGDLLAATAGAGIIGIRLAEPSKPPIQYGRPSDTGRYPKFDPSGQRLGFVSAGPDGHSQFEIVPVSGHPSAAVRISIPEEFADTLSPGPFAWNSAGDRLIVSQYEPSPFYAIGLANGSVEVLPIAERISRAPRILGGKLVYQTQTEWVTNIWALDLSAAGDPRARPLIQSSRRQFSPRFSADGSAIVFSSDRTGSMEIWRSNREGDDLQMLTAAGGPPVGSPAWSPDGKKVVFDGKIDANTPDIYVLDAPGAQPRRLTDSPATDILPVWSADGRWIYFSSGRGGETEIWRIPPEGGEAERVTSGGGWESLASWDGRYFYYVHPGQAHVVRRLDLETGQETSYPELGTAGRDRFWAPTGEGIYFVDRESDAHMIQYLDFATRKASPVYPFGALEAGPGHLAVSPDGRTLLFAQQDNYSEDIMLVDGVK